jgi:hypothetical protein
MSDKKITQLEALTSLEGADLFVVVDNVAESPENKKVAAADVVEFVSNSDVLAGVISTAVGDPIQETVIDERGDLLVGSAPDTINRLGAGNDGEVLTADSNVGDGLKWAAIPTPTIVWENDQNVLANAVFG